MRCDRLSSKRQSCGKDESTPCSSYPLLNASSRLRFGYTVHLMNYVAHLTSQKIVWLNDELLFMHPILRLFLNVGSRWGNLARKNWMQFWNGSKPNWLTTANSSWNSVKIISRLALLLAPPLRKAATLVTAEPEWPQCQKMSARQLSLRWRKEPAQDEGKCGFVVKRLSIVFKGSEFINILLRFTDCPESLLL